MQIFTLLPWSDWLAIVWFFTGWIGYAWFARHYGVKRSSLLGTTNRYRHYWLLQATARDPRVIDGIITQNLSSTPAFFSSTTIIIIGGLFALLGTTDKAAELVREIPFAVRTSVLIFDLKVLLMVAVFVYAFFRFSWSMAARAAIRDVGRVLDFPYGFCDGISKLIPNKPGQHITIEQAKEQEPILAERERKEEDVQTLLALAQKLEGLTRNVGMSSKAKSQLPLTPSRAAAAVQSA